MSIFFTSDTHFGHRNIIKYCNRPFGSVEQMDEGLIANWNAVVQPNDEIFHLGDFGLTDSERIDKILKRLNGIKYFIWGNHDKGVRGRPLSNFVWAKDYHEITVESQKIVLMHFPIESWHKRHHGSWHLHGHCHGTLPSAEWQSRLDVGVDVHNYTPISYSQVKAHMSKKVFKPNDHHDKSGAYVEDEKVCMNKIGGHCICRSFSHGMAE